MFNEGRVEDFWDKINLLRQLMTSNNIETLMMTSLVNFYWLTGEKTFVSIADESSVGKILITENNVFLITSNNELKDIMLDVIVYPWYKTLEETLVNNNINTYTLDIDVEEEIKKLRSILTALEIKRLRWLGKTSARLLESCCKSVSVGDQENEIAGNLSKAFWFEGIEPLVLNLAADERALQYRHPIATDRKVKRYLACSLCVRKWGLHVTLTRIVHFGKPCENLIKKHKAAMTLDSFAIINSQVGANLEDIFKGMLNKYDDLGYPKEWQQHPIGGLIGFKPREFDVTPETSYILQENQAFSWNPTIQGTKSEDTILITSDGVEVITDSGEFDYANIDVENSKIMRSNILIRENERK